MRHGLFRFPAALDANLEGLAAPFTSWFPCRPARVLLDAGEGIAPRLGNAVFLPEAVLLTHAHEDHVGGLTRFHLARSSARGDRVKPLTIYYPRAAEKDFTALQDRVSGTVRRPSFPLTGQAVETGPLLLRHFTVEPFRTHHSVPSCGYRATASSKRAAA